MTDSLTYDSAVRTAIQNAEASVKILPSGVRLEPLSAPFPVVCSDDDGAPDSTPVSVRADYFVTGLPASDNRAHINTLVSHLTETGWTIFADQRPKEDFVSVKKSGFGLAFQLSADGNKLGLTASTPCVPPKNGGK